MKNKLDWNIGVCSWSLNNDQNLLSQLKTQTGISKIHLHIQPELDKKTDSFIADILKQGWQISSGMVGFEQEDYSTLETIKNTGGIVPKNCWEKNKAVIVAAIDILSNLNVPYLSFHFGFVDINNADLINRIKKLADYAQSKNMALLMETGQETAEELSAFLDKINHNALGINFDPANMILYGKGEPIKALNLLSTKVRHIHIKDATASGKTGTWGKEVPWGDGDVGDAEFLNHLAKLNYKGTLSVEREAGSNRMNEIISAVQKVKNFIDLF